MDMELRFHAIFDQAAIGFAFIESKTGRFIRVNNKFCNILGFKKDRILSNTFMAITHPDDLKKDLENMQKILEGEQREFSMEKRYIREDGSIVWGNLTVSALWEKGEKPDFHIALVEDITARKNAEEKLKNLNKLLDQRINERTVELMEKSKSLRKVNDLLKKKELELEIKNQNLIDLNTALKVLIQQKDDSRIELEEKVVLTMETLVEPYLQKAIHLSPNEKHRKLIEIMKENLKELMSSFSQKLSSGYINLTSSEIQVANLIKNSYSNKEIAELLYVSSETVAFHRKNIRKKLGITNTKKNLALYLKAIS